MLLELRVANYRSFAEEQVFSFVADRDDTLAENTVECAESPTGRVIRLAVLYGPNGGGKSTLVRAVEVIRRLVLDTATAFQAGDPLPVEAFRLDPALSRAPSRFEVTFVADWQDPDDETVTRPIRYQYGFTADRARVHEEWLLAYPHGQPQAWFERRVDGKGSAWDFGRHLKGEKTRIARSTRSNALFLSVAAQQNQTQLLPVFEWFRERSRTLGTDGIRWGEPITRRFALTASATSEAILDDESGQVQHFVTEWLKSADVGIEGLSVERQPNDMRAWQPAPPPEFASIFAAHVSETFIVRTLHRARDGAAVEWDLSDESDGTQSLYCLLGPLMAILVQRQAGFVDELLGNLHPALIQRLVRWFLAMSVELRCTAQLLFTTHDTTLLDPKLLRRDQIWFVEKDREGASHLYSLLEYRPRKDEAFQRGYLAGRYGALPFIGEMKF